jgi:hypothetical protein
MADTRTKERSAKRIKVLLSASLHWDNQEETVRVRDLSRWGVCAEAACPPPLGVKVKYVRGPVERSATIIWRKEARFGLRFSEPLRPEDVHIHLPQEQRSTEASSNARLFKW